MKKLLCLCLFLSLIFFACKKNDSVASVTPTGGNKATVTQNMTVDGDIFKNTSYDMTAPSEWDATYDKGINMTTITVGGRCNGDSVIFIIYLNAITMGTNDVGVACVGVNSIIAYVYQGSKVYTFRSNIGTVNITKRDAVGGNIEGTYEGAFKYSIDGVLTTTVCGVTGKFSVKRKS